jgi:acetyltransferase-like isoleucine patch superfamily enzyme
MEEELKRLIEQFKKVHFELGMAINEKWNRSLPFDEELFDRWERAESLGFGSGTSIYQHSIVIGDVTVGENTWIGPYTILDGSGGLKIGSFCSISSGVQIYSHDSVKWALSGGKAAYEKEAVRIGNSCYVGALSVIAKGTTIGNHCLIAAKSFVKGAIPDFSIVLGSPARIVGRVRIDAEGNVNLNFENSSSGEQ